MRTAPRRRRNETAYILYAVGLPCWFGFLRHDGLWLLRILNRFHVRNDFIRISISFLLLLLIPLLLLFFFFFFFFHLLLFLLVFPFIFFSRCLPVSDLVPHTNKQNNALGTIILCTAVLYPAYSMTHNECLGRYILFYFVSLLGRYDWQILPKDAPSSHGRR